MGQSLCQVRFADAGWTTDEEILLPANVVTTGQLHDLLAINAGIEVKGKGLQRLGGVDGGAA